MSSENKIPENPVDNLARVESICAGYRRKLADNRRSHAHIRDALDAKIVELEEEEAKGDIADATLLEGMRLRVRKYQYDLRYFGNRIKELKGQISWAENRQIPFLKSEVERVSDGALTHQPFAEALGESYGEDETEE